MSDGAPLRLAWAGPLEDLPAETRNHLMDRRPAGDEQVRATVTELLADVRSRGDEALLDMARRFDGVEPERLREGLEVPRGRWDEALESLDPPVRHALERAERNIAAFHRAQVPPEVRLETEPGLTVGRRFVALAAAGVYAPGGRAAYPSSVLMGVVPARVAGVPEIVVCSPPGPGGEPPPEVLAAAALAGATRLFAVGGAGAVGAMAFGTGAVPRCDAVVGPGNRWVVEAKRQVAGRVVVDAPAGPSEVLVLADASADPARIAAELVAQAEHDPDAAVLLVTDDAYILEATAAALAHQVAHTPRTDVVRQALVDRGALLLARDRTEARRFARAWAPEHLCLYTSHPREDLDAIPTAGTAFLGHAASVVHGDYVTGANHVLPTAGAARSFSGLSVLHFLRAYTWQEVTPEAAAHLADDVARLARAEGLPAHAAAALLRRDAPPPRHEAPSDGKNKPSDRQDAPSATRGDPP